jgi:hypothetical protein
VNLYKISTIGLLTGIVIACGAAGSDHTSVAHANDAGAGPTAACECVGDPGPQGLQGPPGPVGPAGKDAVCVNDMNNCPPGVPGAQGPAGPQGAKGEPGLSGARGADGLTGAVGPKGEPGASGAAGPQGAPGPAGPAGKNGKDGFSISKSSLYLRSSSATGAGAAIAYCDDENDIVLNGSCTGQAVFWGYIGPYLPTNPELKSGWECKISNISNGPISALVTCLDVP